MIDLFDTHCHTHEMVEKTTPVYDKWRSDGVERDPDEVIAAAHEAGVTRMLCIGTTLLDSNLAVRFVSERDGQWASIGIHPHEAVGHLSSESKAAFMQLVVKPKVIAIGECGLDYFYANSPKDAQIEILRFQIELALQHDLPLSFHVREAFDDFWPIFESYKARAGDKLRGVLHSFTDSLPNLEKAIQHGLSIGVNGIATFAKQAEKSVIYRTIPQHLLLLETDAPFLTPAPFRGKMCESKHVRVTAEYLAKLRYTSLEELSITTTSNARVLFKV